MGKRSNFKRVDKDYYPTIDVRAWEALKPNLPYYFKYAEPCYGGGHLSRMIGVDKCVYSGDVETGQCAFDLKLGDIACADYIITNPPWSRNILHPMIDHFRKLKPTWLLFDADWAHTKQSSEYMNYCKKIVSVGRLIWIEGTKTSGKDNCAWYLFDKEECKTEFVGRLVNATKN